MSNRQDLLDGAKSCLLDKGFSRTTARDIASAAGVSLAAIGYHFRTKDALLGEALQLAMREWGDSMEQRIAAGTAADSAAHFTTAWDVVVASFAEDRSLWSVQFEVLAHMDSDSNIQGMFVEANAAAQTGLLSLFGMSDRAQSGSGLGRLLQMLISGAASQWLVDPDSVPSGAEMRAVVLAASGQI